VGVGGEGGGGGGGGGGWGGGGQGSAGYELETNVETNVQLKTSVDPFATYEFWELPVQPELVLVAGPAVRWKAIMPSLVVIGEPFRLAIVAEDVWGNPSPSAGETLTFAASNPICGLPSSIRRETGRRATVIDNLIV